MKVITCGNVTVTYREFGRKSKCVHYVNGTFFVVMTWKITFVAHLGTFWHNIYEYEVRFGIGAILTENVPFKISHFTYFHIFFTFMWHICENMWNKCESHFFTSSHFVDYFVVALIKSISIKEMWQMCHI